MTAQAGAIQDLARVRGRKCDNSATILRRISSCCTNPIARFAVVCEREFRTRAAAKTADHQGGNTVGDTNKNRFRVLATAASSLAMLIGFGGAAFAQTTTTTPPPATEAEGEGNLDEIVVTGFRGALNNAAAVKEKSDSIVEVISAEDIGKLPDVSIAESLARLPGLAIQRLDGRGQQLSVRGLGPDYTTALLNGREQVTVGDNRGVEFDQFPSDLLSGVVVYKTPDAALIGQGLMGTVDMRTLRPLSAKDRIVAFGARYEWNEKGALNSDSDDTGYRINFTYADKFANDTIGVAIGISSISTPTQSERFNAWGYPDAGPGGARVIGGSKSYVQSNDLDRDGFIGILEYQPDSTFKTSIDIYYSNFEEKQILRGIELPLAWSSATLAPGATVSNGLVTAGTFNGVKGVIRNDVNLRNADLSSIGWNAQWNWSNGWGLELDWASSKVERKDRYLETYSGTGPSGVGATDNIGFRTTAGEGTRFTPTLNYGNFGTIVLTSPQGWGTDAGAGRPFGQAGFDNNPTIEDTLDSLRISATKEDLGAGFKSLEFGINVSSRDKEKVANEFFLAVAGGAPSAVIPTGVRTGTTNLGFLGLGPMVSYDPLRLLGTGALVSSRNTNADVVTKSWTVTEDVTTLYAKADFEGDLGDFPVRGNFGLQVVTTDQESTGFQGTAGLFRKVTIGDTYTEWLPSMNFTVDFNNNTLLRIAAARTLARARMDQLRASQELGRNDSNLTSTNPAASYFSSSGGNPKLRPYIASGLDISLEHYFDKGGYISLASYYKKLDNWVFGSFGEIVDFTAFRPLLTTTQNAQLGTPLGVYSSPRNLDGGYISGFEFAASVPFELFTPALEGFGVVFSYSSTDSEIEPIPGITIPVPGLSEEVINTTLYFERDGFQARVSNRFRSNFLGEVNGFGGGRDLRSIKEESIVDAQISYEFQGGPLNGLSVMFQGLNLTDEPFTSYEALNESRTIDYQQYGSTFLIGLNYKLN
jgi:iron complex outermembrane recepter protein